MWCGRRAAARRRARAIGLDPTRPLLALLPGSRKKELRHLLRPAHRRGATARRGRLAGRPGLGAHADARRPARRLGGPLPAICRSSTDDTYNVVHAADAALVASGTATVETALLGWPMVIMYRVSPLTFAVARLLVHVDHIGMPNIILGRRVFPELIQADVTRDKLVAALHDVTARRDEVAAALIELRGKLGEPGAANRAAQLALELMA